MFFNILANFTFKLSLAFQYSRIAHNTLLFTS